MFRKISGTALVACLLLIHSQLQAQSYAETALLFSRTQPTGSARIQGLAGTQVSLGGDYSSALSNPAGLGMYNRSEFTFSPAITSYQSNASVGGNSMEESLSKFNVPGLSYVFNMPRDNNGFLGGSFGVSLTRVNDFNGSTIYNLRNNNNSIIDYFMERANGGTIDQFDSNNGNLYNDLAGLAYFNYLIGPRSILDPPGEEDEYFTDAPIASDQREEITTKGKSYQWSFAYGGNYKDILFFGGGLGITTLRYESQKIFGEQYVDSDTIRAMSMVENLEVRGSGVNATLGVIVRPVSFLQIGVSFISPTYYQLTETYGASMNSNWANYDYWDGSKYVRLSNQEASTDDIVSEYNLTTPLKLSAGLTFISKYGFITGEVERTNAGQARYSSDIEGISYSGENDDIKRAYDAVWNYRVGAEGRYKIFRLRAGYGIQNSPYANGDIDSKIETISGGAGLKFKKVSVDFAWVSRSADSFYSPYTLNDNSQPVVSLKNKVNTGVITVGFSF